MSDTKFTQAEWKIFSGSNRYEYVGAVSDEVIAMVYLWPTTGDIESKANLSLIASAPEMYEALQEMVDMYCDLVNSGDAGNWNPEEDFQTIQARKALAKARG